MLVQMDRVGSSSEDEKEKKKIMTVMGATNRPWDLDDVKKKI